MVTKEKRKRKGMLEQISTALLKNLWWLREMTEADRHVKYHSRLDRCRKYYKYLSQFSDIKRCWRQCIFCVEKILTVTCRSFVIFIPACKWRIPVVISCGWCNQLILNIGSLILGVQALREKHKRIIYPNNLCVLEIVYLEIYFSSRLK